MKHKIIHRFYNWFGYSVEIRIQSPDFQKRLKRLSNLLDDRQYEVFQKEYEDTCKLYDRNDVELIRLSWLAEDEF